MVLNCVRDTNLFVVSDYFRVEPSMEMKAALKVLNDSIHRPQRSSSKLLVNAIDIVRREWIQVNALSSFRR